jgi:nucleotide-binding universal stress UspA family protein
MARKRRVASRILVATDFSEGAAAALDWGRELARAHAAEVVLVHALEDPVASAPAIPGQGTLAPMGAELVSLREEAERSLSELAARSSSPDDPPVRTRLEAGPAGRAVVEVAREIRPLIVVAGTAGRTGLSKLLLGSVTEELTHRVECPVLVVHPADRGRHRPIRRILVPTDLSDDTFLALDAAARLLRPLWEEAQLFLLHANVLGSGIGKAPAPAVAEEIGAAHEALAELAGTLQRQGLPVEILAFSGKPAEVIAEQAQAVKADLVCITRRALTGLEQVLFGGTTDRVVPRAPCPVLSVRRPDAHEPDEA